MASIKIILRDKPTKEGLYPVVLRVIKNRKSKLISLGLECIKKDWDEDNNQFKKTQANHVQRNRLLLKHKDRALKIIDDFFGIAISSKNSLSHIQQCFSFFILVE